MAEVIAGEAFAAGLRTEFLKTYDKKYSGLESLDVAMQRNVPSDKFQEKFFFFESAPYMKLWKRGTTMHEGQFKGVQWTVTNGEWAESIKWHYANRQDDQTRSLMNRASDLGKNATLLDEQNFFDILINSAAWDRLEAIPLAPDGHALYYGSTRFGLATGNVISGATVATAANVRTDFYKAVAGWLQFQDTEGKPLLSRSVLDGGMTIFCGAANVQVFGEAFSQKFTAIGANTATSNAAVSNIVQDMGLSVKIIPTQYITDNDWFIFLNASDVKPIFSLKRDGVQDVVSTFQNSDECRKTGMESIRFWERRGYGVNMPYATFMINN
jgi:hypothetical protein